GFLFVFHRGIAILVRGFLGSLFAGHVFLVGLVVLSVVCERRGKLVLCVLKPVAHFFAFVAQADRGGLGSGIPANLVAVKDLVDRADLFAESLGIVLQCDELLFFLVRRRAVVNLVNDGPQFELVALCDRGLFFIICVRLLLFRVGRIAVEHE